MSDVKSLYDQISKIYGENLPKQVVVDILGKIPRKLEEDEDAYDQYVYLNQVYTYGEYKSSLSMYDKRYYSPMHDYGEKEELIYSYRYVIPGLIKDHKIRNNRGRFNHESQSYEATHVDINRSNIYLIKHTIWDSIKFDKKMVTYKIYVYCHNNAIESQRRKEAETTLNGLKQSLSEKGQLTNGSETSEIC